LVTLRFKLSELGTVELTLERPVEFRTVLERCSQQTGTSLGSVIAVRSGKVLNLQDIVYTDDVVDVFPAISGG